MPGEITPAHQRGVAAVLSAYPGSAIAGFWAAHRKLCAELGVSIPKFPFTPDAYRLNREAGETEIFEVEVSSPLTKAKAALLGDFWEAWDEETADWLPVLFVVDRYGNINRMDLMHAHYRTGWAEVL